MASPPAAAQPLATSDEILAGVAEVAAAISADHPDGVVLVGVLKAASILLADLARRLTVPCRIEFLAIAPFDGETTRTRVVKDLDSSVAGEPLVLVCGIVDTGLTSDFLRRHLAAADPSSVRIATLLDKRARRLLPVEADYAVLDAPDEFVIGYGLDLRGRYRNLRDLWVVPPDVD